MNFNLFENLQQAKALLKSQGRLETDPTFVALRQLTQKHPGYLGFFTKMWLSEVSYDDLVELYQIILQETYIKNLPKNVIEYTKWEDLQDDLIKAKNQYLLKSIIDELPTTQKELVKEANKGKQKFVTLNNYLIKLAQQKDKTVFLQKIARYKTLLDLSSALKNFIDNRSNFNFPALLKTIQQEKIKLIYQDPDQDIIVVEVNNFQLRTLASDTSWCILNSSTFNSYVNGIDRQYIILLTDLENNYRKIGVTYGMVFKTAHLVDDTYIGQTQLNEITSARGFQLNQLTIPLDQIKFDSTYTNDLLRNGVSKEIILQNKKVYQARELSSFTRKEIEEYHLNDKIAIQEQSVAISKTLTYLMQNKHLLQLTDRSKIGIDELVKMNPQPREIKLFDTNDQVLTNNFSSSAIYFIEGLQKGKKLNSFRSDGVNAKIYAFRYFGYGVQNLTWKELVESFKDEETSSLKKILEMAQLNGYEVTTEMLIQNLKKPYFDSSMLDSWLSLAEEYPQIQEHVDQIVSLVVKGDTQRLTSEEHDFLNQNNVYYKQNLRDMYVSPGSKKLEKYPELEKMVQRDKDIKLYSECIPNKRIQNWGLRIVKEKLRKIFPTERLENSTPKIIVEYFYPLLQDQKFHLSDSINITGIGQNGTVYMMNSLFKEGKIDLLDQLKISFTQKDMMFYIRVLFDMEYSAYVHPDFVLSPEEREVACEWLVQNKDKVRKDVINVIVSDMSLYQHEAVGFIYWFYNWGFQNYFNLVKKFKVVNKEKWEIIDGENHVTKEENRVDFFKEIFHYLKKKNDLEGVNKLKAKISTEMVLKPSEVKTLSYLTEK